MVVPAATWSITDLGRDPDGDPTTDSDTMFVAMMAIIACTVCICLMSEKAHWAYVPNHPLL